MSQSRKSIGTQWETDVVNFLRSTLGARGVAFKPRQEGLVDVGDIHVDADFVLQCKNWRTWSKADLHKFVDAANLQARQAGRPYGASCVKRRKAPGSTGSVKTGLVTMDLETFAQVVHDLREGREAVEELEERDYDSES
jgi:hypothetical protein